MTKPSIISNAASKDNQPQMPSYLSPMNNNAPRLNKPPRKIMAPSHIAKIRIVVLGEKRIKNPNRK